MLVSGKILRKKVTPSQWGNSIMFVVLDHGQERMVSCFDSKLSDEAKNILQALVEGMCCDFEVIESPSKKGDGKIYLNITSATPITQLRDEVVAPVVQSAGLAAPAGQAGTPRKELPEIGKIVGTCTQYAVLYANQKMAITKEVVPLDEVKEVAAELARFQAELITTWGE